MSECKEFGAALRRERERRGIDLEAVADRTKIGLALLTGLERGDLSRWPSGIFRRAFVRAYADAIGLSPDELVDGFERVFPERSEHGVVSVPAFAHAPSHGDSLRLTLASSPTQSLRAWLVRGAAVAADVAVVLGAGTVVALAWRQPVELVTLAVGALYFTTGTLLFEASPAIWVSRRWRRARPVTAIAAELGPITLSATDETESKRPDGPMLRSGHRDRRQGRPERRRVPRPVQRPQ